ncbi:MAG TPA: hypothetical protein VMJ10_28970 [Kofleriaceae bacterium]|nr:hypothetical protein [Kofleriaceae bacterium]
MRNLILCAALAACGSHHSGGTGDGGLCDANDPTCGTPSNPVIVPCSGCMQFPPLGPGSPPACTDPSTDPQLVYPPDGVLLPPNMNVIAVQFMPGNNNTLFEIDFENAATDVRLETMCNAITDTRGVATGGCDFELDPTDWNYVATHNAGGDPVMVTVRGIPASATCVAGSNSRNISFATMPLMGGIYYWQSVAVNGVAGTTGGIFRKDFGNPDPTPEPFLTPGTQNKCVGCHYLSRDGLKMVYGSDDADSDDELGDDHFVLYDVATGTAAVTNLTAGFAAWQADAHDEFIMSVGAAMGMMSVSPELVPFDGTMGKAGTAFTFTAVSALSGLRITNPDWSRDGTMVYFTATTPITNVQTSTGCGPSGTMPCMYNNKDDIHCTNGSIWSVPVTGSGTSATLGTPTPLVSANSASENDYYPAISPDGSTVVFDQAIGTTMATQDSYNNPNATLMAVRASGGTPIALANANYKAGMTNSWPRWSPFVQQYKGQNIVWVTFSSTRNYGLRVHNEDPSFFNCYPPVSPEDPSGDHSKPFDPNCTQPQIWMAAISLDQLASGQDGSFPAFWLPFQDYTAHNHIAQWVDSIMTQPNCQQVGQDCTTLTCCNGETCDPTTHQCDSVIF